MIESDVDVAIAAVEAGAGVVARSYGGDPARFATSPTDVTTQTDIDAETAIAGVLAEHRPDDGRVGEELGSVQGANGRRWLVDPLCGTLNFAAGTPLVAVNVALVEGTTTLAAAVADPVAGEVFWVDRGRAWLRRGGSDEPLSPSARSGLVDVNCDGPLDEPFVGAQLVGDPLLRATYGPRVISSTLGVAWVAAGRRAAYVSDGWLQGSVHFAAGIALCQASGCIVTDLDGFPVHTDRGLVVAADRPTHDRVLALVQPHLRAVRDGA